MNLSENLRRRFPAVAILERWPLLPVIVIWLVLFWPMITGQKVVGFRDSAYFYYPYFKWIDQQWAKGEIPLWNPWCDRGYPVVADGTSSVFYPGKFIFCFRFFDFSVRYGLYLALHVLLAICGAYRMARSLGADRIGAAFSGCAYGFGGSCLFQVCNVVYLVSSAWLPFGLMAVWNMPKSRRLTNSLGAGVVAAMMILGGDPQMAYLLASIAGITMLWRLNRVRARFVRRGLLARTSVGYLSRFGLFLACTFLLASIQILPTWFWAMQSSRQRSDWSVAGLTLAHLGGESLEAVYQFSQPPWTLAEMIWPNISGRPFPLNHRWVEILPGNDRFWTPSLYVGLLTVLLGIGGLRIWGRKTKHVWLTMLLFLFAGGSFGWYGLVWFYNEFAIALHLPQQFTQFGPYVGGLYWLATILLPKFVLFRYPAKLFIVASLAVCVLAGIRLNHFSFRRVAWLAIPTLSLSLVAFSGLPQVWPEYSPAAVASKTSPAGHLLFGPLDWERSLEGVQTALFHTAVIATLILIAGPFPDTRWRRMFALLILCGDLLVANGWLIAQVDTDVFEAETSISRRFRDIVWDRAAIPAMIPGDLYPHKFTNTRSQNRLAAVVRHQRENLFPKHHLDLPVRLLGSFASIEHPRRSMIADRRQLLDSGEPPKPFRRAAFELVPTVSDSVLPTIEERDERAGLVEIALLQANRVELRVVNRADARLNACITPDAGWHARVEAIGESAGVTLFPKLEYEIDQLSLVLPAGDFHVTLEYSPREFWIGSWISLVSWIGLTSWWLFHCPKHCLAGLGWIDVRRLVG